MYFHRKSNSLSSSPQHVGITGGFDIPFQPQGGEIDYWLGQTRFFFKNLNLKRGIRTVIKRVVNHSPPSILHVFTQVYNCSWVGVHTCTNETHSLALLQDLIPTLAA